MGARPVDARRLLRGLAVGLVLLAGLACGRPSEVPPTLGAGRPMPSIPPELAQSFLDLMLPTREGDAFVEGFVLDGLSVAKASLAYQFTLAQSRCSVTFGGADEVSGPTLSGGGIVVAATCEPSAAGVDELRRAVIERVTGGGRFDALCQRAVELAPKDPPGRPAWWPAVAAGQQVAQAVVDRTVIVAYDVARRVRAGGAVSQDGPGSSARTPTCQDGRCRPSAGPGSTEGDPVRVLYPFEGTLFPADFRAPEFQWEDWSDNTAWLLRFSFRDAERDLEVRVDKRRWTPPREVWERIKKASLETPASLDVYGLASAEAPRGTGAHLGFSTSADPVGAPIFYRRVSNPFPDDEDFTKMEWRLCWVSSYAPPFMVMEEETRCFNCHAASADGTTFGIEYNARGDGNDRGGYLAFRNPGQKVTLRPENFFDWNDALPKKERASHQAILSAISPDGRFVVTSGKAMTSVALIPRFVQRDGFLGCHLITKGILVVHSLDDKTFAALPGADDERVVHVPGSWSLDGETIYFFRAPISPLFDALNREPLDDRTRTQQERLEWAGINAIYDLKYDVYRIPYNGGRGGEATPVAGASHNGRSNYFPRVSPDGRWVVFTQSDNGMMFLPDESDLYIVPAAGGEARRLDANGPGAESWHSWSPNGRWLVFSSKSHGAETDLVLTHIDDEGRDSPPVLLTQIRDDSGLSANLPEFFKVAPGHLEKIELLGLGASWAESLRTGPPNLAPGE